MIRTLRKVLPVIAISAGLMTTAAAQLAGATVTPDDPSQEQEARYEYLQFHAKINNLTTYALKVDTDKTQIDWGKWGKMPTEIPTKSEIETFWSQGRANSPSGTSGYVRYYLAKDDADKSIGFTVNFSTPAMGSNQCSVSDTHEDLIVQSTQCPDGSENSQNASFKVAYVG